MSAYIQRGEIQVAQELDEFIAQEAMPGTQMDAESFWSGFNQVLDELIPQNETLLTKRDTLQRQIDEYCQSKAGNFDPEADLPAYKAFLKDIGYLCPDVDDFHIGTQNVDAEIATMAGPQLVVPINNARYALNAVNARWGSFYDAIYGTDVLSESGGAEKGSAYNPVRGARVVEYVRQWLDIIMPLDNGSHAQSTGYHIVDNGLIISLGEHGETRLQHPEQLVGFNGERNSPSELVISHHGLHIVLQIDGEDPIGKTDPAGIKDILVESALTTIMDCEDSVAAVDAEDKTLVYRNWLGLMKGSLSTEVAKGNRTITRTMADDPEYLNVQGESCSLPGRSLMFVRNVGHLMTNDAMLFRGRPVPEGIMDAMITSLIAKHDLLGNSKHRNSRTGSVYIVKPKMHGPEEVAFADTLFSRVEQVLGLEANTLKMGIMDEERRTSINLKACIFAARQRAVFINTGFLDRTGDEIHTSMHLGPFAAKGELKQKPWIQAYEKANVITGLATGMSGKAQIGKGMWPIPDHMAEMLETKIGHPMAGANTAWVPSPTAATLHALHYHQVDVFARQQTLLNPDYSGVDDILTVPLMDQADSLTPEQIQRELDNNVQGILGYVVRWVHQGIGCSKVPDINNVGLMEDRATLRISSQHLANWLLHGLISEQQIKDAMLRMAALVDEQNASDPEYIPMMPTPSATTAFQAAEALIFEGCAQPNGYTEPLLHAKRREMKQLS